MINKASISVCSILSILTMVLGASAETLRVGVRDDAIPFSYATSTRSRENDPTPIFFPGHDGFVVRVCDRALQALHKERPGLDVEVVSVPASSRFAALGHLEKNQEFEIDKEIDILCDPSSLTRSRLQSLTASFPIFLSGVTFAQLDPIPEDWRCVIRVGLVQATTASETGIRSILESGRWKRFEPEIIAAMEAEVSDSRQARLGSLLNCPEDGVPVVKFYPDHDSLVADFCAGRLIYYVGDIDIVRAQVRSQPDCPAHVDDETFTEERYVIYGRRAGDAGKLQLLSDFYRLLAVESMTPPPGERSALVTSYGIAFQLPASARLRALIWSITGEGSLD
ncbi:type 2 periplasmic-binding domain-containing protein [Paracoccus rhizosphaerae]|uniref:Extracellular solute-binding protein, family 3 n=1 Tax=Paracoccus rhizosphaerae TaxID=1133347 RepID=A0ABV6CIZ1_9RHOB|nr:hypothetical protein [Paracoccus rhizosphaerae]